MKLQLQLHSLFTITTTPTTTTSFVGDVDITGDVVASGTITCVSLTQTSDESVKAGIENINTTIANSILSGCNARTFVRTDLGESTEFIHDRRAGFIAQELQAVLPREWTNIVHDNGGLLSVSYDRLVCVLWTCLQDTNKRLEALEAKKTTKKK